MDLLDLLKLMFRRWYVTAPIALVTLGAAVAFGAAIQPEYKSSVAVLLVPPTTSAAAPAPDATPRPGNPWLRVGEASMAQAVQITISAHEARSRVAAAGGDPDYEPGLVNRSSILTVDITAASRESALATVKAVTALITDEVARQQAQYNPRPGEQITTEVLDPGLNITPSRSNVFRAQVVIIAIGLLLAATAAVIHDALARRRAAARIGQRGSGAPAVAWNAGQATVSGRRSGPAAPGAVAAAGTPSVSALSAGTSPAPAMRPGPGSPEGGDPGPRRTGRSPEPHPAGDQMPDTLGTYRSGAARTPQSDETIMLTSVRSPGDESDH